MAKQSLNSNLQYRIFTWILFPAAFIHCLITAIKFRHLPYLYQRLGIYSQHEISTKPIWCHCASVGELNTALPLLRKLIENNYHLIISTNTITSKEVFNNAKLTQANHIFLPLDYKWMINRFLDRYTPKYCLIFETELWPNILLTTLNRSTPISIINGRISNKTLHAPSFLKTNYQKILTNISQILASNSENARRFISLGADNSHVQIYENLKYANLIPNNDVINECAVSHPFLLCASTHEGEEKDIVEQWHNEHPSELGLVIAIRHPHRAKDVCKAVKSLGYTCKLHSQHPTDISVNDVYIIDTIGELVPFIKHAEIVFMGGSLVPIGGHNILEPAQFGKCIITGHHYDSFADIVQGLLDCKGIVVVQNSKHLMDEINRLVTDKESRTTIGNNARQFLESRKDVLENYSSAVLKMLN